MNQHLKRSNLTIGLFILVFAFSIFADDRKNVFKGQTSIQKPFELRDPFQPPRVEEKVRDQTRQNFDGKLSNVEEIPDQFNINTARVSGVLIGKDRRAMVTIGNGGKVYVLKEGDEFGAGGVVIKAILPGGIILVEKITNIYGEDEFIETVIPISR